MDQMIVKVLNNIKIFGASFALIILVSSNVLAQTKVVVIPMAGDEVVRQPSFRIVPTSASPEAATSGRLEFTSDKNPSPKSTWGKVCDDCFEGDVSGCPTSPAPRTHSAAVAVCKDMGYETGIALTAAPNFTGSLGFTLDDVNCPDGANSFDACSSRAVNTHNCVGGEDVDVQCFAESPKITFSGFTLDCANGFQDETPFGFSRINDSDLTNAVLEPTFDDDVVRSIANIDSLDDALTFSLDPTDDGTGKYRRVLECDTGETFSISNDVLTVVGTSGLRWRVSTSVSNTASTITVSDIVFELTP